MDAAHHERYSHHEGREGHEDQITERISNPKEKCCLPSCSSCAPLKYRAEEPLSVQVEPLDYVIPAWSAGIQVDMDVSGGILANLDAGNPCRHDEALHFHLLRASVRS